MLMKEYFFDRGEENLISEIRIDYPKYNVVFDI